ncbi:hypothetical protein [Streptomyces sp. URMC 123]|uniref:hypothetical protein n=1 Tax=Streptomyces sp. URMC 123 TaxID=3423403 RepID=UPI003F1AB80E
MVRPPRSAQCGARAPHQWCGDSTADADVLASGDGSLAAEVDDSCGSPTTQGTPAVVLGASRVEEAFPVVSR